MNRARSIAITSTSALCCLGDSPAAVMAAIRDRRSGLSAKHSFSDWTPALLGEARGFDDTRRNDDDSRLARMTVAAVDRVARQSRVFERYAPEDIGFLFGSTTAGGDALLDLFFAKFDGTIAGLGESLEPRHMLGVVESAVKRAFPIRGPSMTIATACSSSANALAEALFLLRSGTCKVCIAGGMDTLGLMTICGFDSLQVLDHKGSRPFHKDRAGMSLSEGGAFLVLESQPDTKPKAWLSGAGASSDAYHITQPDPTGAGMARCMQAALRDARLEPGAIGYINAHGTGTRLNDESEATAIHSVFGNQTPVSSTKGFHGHTLGGAGALEAVLCVETLADQRPLAGRLGDMDFEGMICHSSNETSDGFPHIDHVLSNSFGFGGSNASLVFSREGVHS